MLTTYNAHRAPAQERKLLRLLEAALNVSEYVDKVDVLSYRSKTQRMHAQVMATEGNESDPYESN